MPLYEIDELVPQLADDAWAAPSADLIGDVRLGARASVWFGAVIRADNTPIILGEETNFQDGAIGHSDPGAPLTIGARVTVGHQAILHGCTVADDCLIGMGAILLNGCRIGEGSIIAAGTSINTGSSHLWLNLLNSTDKTSKATPPRNSHRCRGRGRRGAVARISPLITMSFSESMTAARVSKRTGRRQTKCIE